MTDGDLLDHFLYLRKSSGRKPLPRQRSLTTVHVEKQGGRIAAEFADADRTAFRKVGGEQPDRKGFAAMLAALQAQPGVAVAAWHADRLTRNDEDTAALIRVCAAGGHLVVTPGGGTYDLSTANGRRRLRDDASAAIYEVDHNTERVLAGRAEVAAEGRWLGGKRPFGWESDKNPLDDGGKPRLDEDGNPVRGILRLRQAEADALAKAHRQVLAGAALGSIARDWNAEGILTPTGKQWRPAEVGRVLRRPRNAGLMEHQGRITGAADWPPVVDETTWRGVAAILADPGRKSSPGPASVHLLSWLARCGVCDGPLICTSTSRAAAKGKSRRLVYRCREGTRGHLCRDKKALEDFIEALVISRMSRDDAAELLEDPPDGKQESLAELYQEKAAISALMLQRDRLHRQRVITDQMLTEGLAELKQELAAVEKRIEEAGRADILAPLAQDPGVWHTMGLDQRRAVIARLMTITVMPAPKGRPAGWRPGKPYFVSSSVAVDWKRRPAKL